MDKTDKKALDTKSQIFNAAVRLFAQNGYEAVSIRTIADIVGIKTASIYYHFASKEDILYACYNYFLEHRYDTRLTRDEYEPILRNGSKAEVLHVLNYAFPEEVLENMILSLLIIFSRIYTDPKAREIYAEDVELSMKYMEEFFGAGVEIGRFREFNIYAVSIIILSTRLFLAQSITMSPEQKSKWSAAELAVFEELLNIVPFKY